MIPDIWHLNPEKRAKGAELIPETGAGSVPD